MKNNQKGITLIALVVTIIVLLILAGVSIAMVAGNSGILGNAQTAAWKTKLSDAASTYSLYITNYMTDYQAVTFGGQTSSFSETYTDEFDAFNKGLAKAKAACPDDIKLDTATAEKNLVDTNGNVTKSTLVEDNKLTLTYADKYTITGTFTGGILTWGEPTAK